jgi:UDP-N-acetylglucosamine diphosphorylase/glucosamine-1-phosphate N-acetyltransferase
MRLILVDRSDELRRNFFPLALSRPLWELRCGVTTLEEKLVAKLGTDDAAYFVPDYMADAYRTRTKNPVNDISVLTGDDVVLLDPRIKAEDLHVPTKGKSEVGLDEQGRVLYACIAKGDPSTWDPALREPSLGAGLKGLAANNIEDFIASAKADLPNIRCRFGTWNYLWDLVLANPDQITADFAAAGKCGIEGKVEQPGEILGSKTDIFVGPGARVHPMVVIDAENGPVYIDQGAEIQPFSRIEGPCYIGKESILLGAKCRSGNTFGPCCRIGGEVEQSIIHGYSNKYHDGFIGHSYIGQWVNLGALTTNSDLKNDYSTVSVTLEGQSPIDTGSAKIGSFIGDHAKTSIGTLLNTGSYVGAMAIIVATGKPLPKFIPSFAWFVEGVVTKGFGRNRLYETAKVAMSRRGCEWTQTEQMMWNSIFQMTAPARDEAIKRGRKDWKRKS